MNKKNITIIFLIWELFLYVVFNYINFSSHILKSSSRIEYLSIISCFIFSIVIIFLLPKAYSRNYTLAGALFFAVCADYFLLFTNNFLPGIFFFFLVQSCYFVYLHAIHVYLKHVMVLFGICLAESFILYLVFKYVDFLVPFLTAYLGMTFLNIFYYGRSIKKKKSMKNFCILLGIILLFLCDLNVGLSNLPDFLPVYSSFLLHYSSIAPSLIWLFYLPSQVCIALVLCLDEN